MAVTTDLEGVRTGEPGRAHRRVRRCAPGAGLLLAATATVVWSGSFVTSRALHDSVPPVQAAFWRWIIAIVAVAPVALRRPRRHSGRAEPESTPGGTAGSRHGGHPAWGGATAARPSVHTPCCTGMRRAGGVASFGSRSHHQATAGMSRGWSLSSVGVSRNTGGRFAGSSGVV